MKMIATREMRFQGRTLLDGDEFEPSDAQARVFRALGKAKDAPQRKAVAKKVDEPKVEAPEAEVAEPVVKTRSMKAEPEDVPALKSTSAAKKATYKRRDMKAED